MSHVADPSAPGRELSDRAVATLRTAVPGLWAACVTTLIAWLSAQPWAPADVVAWLADALGDDLAVALVVSAVLAAWYWLWRRLEPLVPAWLVRIVLGSARTPTYAPVSRDGVVTITALADDDALAGR